MEFNWIMSPLTQYALMAAGLAGSIGLWFHTQGQLRALDAAIREYRANLETAKLFQRADPLPAAGADQAELTLTRRSQILRMHRRGESVETITAALQIPRNEVDLMLKLNRG